MSEAPGKEAPQKRSRKPLLVKMAALAVMVVASMEWFTANYVIGWDEQEISCIPGKHWVIGDRDDREIVRDGVFIVESQGIEPLYDDGTLLVKFLRALPGDTVRVGPDGVFVNNRKVADAGLPLADKLGQEPEYFYGEKVLGEDEYWILGTAPESFDSRYWGSVTYDQIQARAYPLF